MFPDLLPHVPGNLAHMSQPIISIENLGKRYRIHHERAEGYTTLRDVITRTVKGLFTSKSGNRNSQSSDEDFWALKGVSFEVQPGEVVGIIGRNGAGKSTLLKILSRITESTEGRVTLRGRVASLLEVGTGFHPELTGRENIFLNGAILGMTRAEIRKKFDEIVAFAEVEKFLDTPVKRYSSGMYVRLAFAVAAHLEPEILIVDEVLAVGDAAFQRKCIGKMSEVARHGRTVLFVSHNMQALQALCESAILIEKGRIKMRGGVRDVVAAYLADAGQSSSECAWSGGDAPGDQDFKLLSFRAIDAAGESGGHFPSSKDMIIELEFNCATVRRGLCVGFDLISIDGETVLRTYQTDTDPANSPALRAGHNRWRCRLPAGLLNSGAYSICPRIGIHNVNWIVHLENVVQFSIVLDHGVSPYWNSIRTKKERPGVIAPILDWIVA